jgi:hypothetical protein
MRYLLYRLAGLLMIAVFALSSALVLGQGVSMFPPLGELSTGERELKAIAQAYPDRIESVELRDGDWAIQMDGDWYYWPWSGATKLVKLLARMISDRRFYSLRFCNHTGLRPSTLLPTSLS